MMTTKTSLTRTTAISIDPLRFHSIYDGKFDTSTSPLFQDRGMQRVNLESNPQIAVFNGGSDIGTVIYGEKPCDNGGPLAPSQRDLDEIAIFDKFKNVEDVLLVGICRGSQLLNCLNGGTLWQDVNNHGRSHPMTIVETGEVIETTSTHHQMMRPTKDAVIIAVADQATRKAAETDYYCEAPGRIHWYDDDHKDTEIVYYPATHSLCIQGHPEYVIGSRFANFCLDLITKLAHERIHAHA